MMKSCIVWLIAVVVAHVPLVAAQEFSITSAGEMDLDTDLVTVPGSASSYFGMYVAGLGPAMIQVTVGDVSQAKAIMLRDSSTRYVSYLLNSFSEQMEDFDPIFKRGIKGPVTVAVLDNDGVLADSVQIELNVRGTKKFCGRKKNGKKKRCTQPLTTSLKASQKQIFGEEFLSSIRGPIYLEP